MERNTFIWLAPSIRAASSRLLGIVSKNPFATKTFVITEPLLYTSTRAQCEFSSPSVFSST
ncbi:hypothetical protein D3C75_1128590 [compost metagenome]